jgi:hypothetical protein
MSAADQEHQQHEDRQVAAHQHAAAVHDQAAQMPPDAAEFFGRHDKPAQAEHEQQLALAEKQKAAASREQAEADRDQ